MPPNRQRQRKSPQSRLAQHRPAPLSHACQVIPAGVDAPCLRWGHGDSPRLCKDHRSEYKALYLAYKSASEEAEKLRALVDAEPDWDDRDNWTAQKVDAAISARESYVGAIADEIERRETHTKRFVAKPDEGHLTRLDKLRAKHRESEDVLTQLHRCRSVIDDVARSQAENARKRRAAAEDLKEREYAERLREAAAAQQARVAASRYREEEARRRADDTRRAMERARQEEIRRLHEACEREEMQRRAAAMTARTAWEVQTRPAELTSKARAQVQITTQPGPPPVYHAPVAESRASQNPTTGVRQATYSFVPPTSAPGPIVRPAVMDVERQDTAIRRSSREGVGKALGSCVLLALGLAVFFALTRWFG